jgi:hypothetical protein
MPNFRQRLSPARQRIYDRSNATPSIALKASTELRQAVAGLPAALTSGEPHRVQQISQRISDEICRSLRVPMVQIQVQGSRPSNTRGELHGLYTPLRNGSATIKVWMITAKLGRVVAFKTFLRTLLHEICHHLDYALLRLGDSLHTDGFYKRESSLFYQTGAAAVATNRASETGE